MPPETFMKARVMACVIAYSGPPSLAWTTPTRRLASLPILAGLAAGVTTPGWHGHINLASNNGYPALIVATGLAAMFGITVVGCVAT